MAGFERQFREHEEVARAPRRRASAAGGRECRHEPADRARLPGARARGGARCRPSRVRHRRNRGRRSERRPAPRRWPTRWSTAAPTGRASGATSRPGSPSAGSRSSTSTSARTSRCTSAPLHLVFNGEIYNYRELRDELAALGHALRHRGRRRGAPARLARVGRGCARPPQRDVRLRGLGREARRLTLASTRSARSRSTTRAHGRAARCSPPRSRRCCASRA